MNFLYQAVMAVAFMLGMTVLGFIVVGPAAILHERTGDWWYLLLIGPSYQFVIKGLSFIIK